MTHVLILELKSQRCVRRTQKSVTTRMWSKHIRNLFILLINTWVQLKSCHQFITYIMNEMLNLFEIGENKDTALFNIQIIVTLNFIHKSYVSSWNK